MLIDYEKHTVKDGKHILSNGGKTIGYGHDITGKEHFYLSKGLNEYQSLNLLLEDLDKSHSTITRYIDTLNTNFNYSIEESKFSENEILFLIDFTFNRGAGLVTREDLKNAGKPYSSIAILITAVYERDDDRIIQILKEETYNKKGVYYEGLKLRRMDEYDILRSNDFKREYDIERGYRKKES